MTSPKRKSHTTIGKIYFWTATIHKWQQLLASDTNKRIIIEYLKKLSDQELITVYGFVIMPTHIHFIWQQNKMNGKETPFGSFLKFTAHVFLSALKNAGQSHNYEVKAANKCHEIWKRDSLAIEIFSEKVAIQKLEYIHANPVKGKWMLAKDDISYCYSSSKYYETGIDDFGFMKNIFRLFNGK